MVSVVSQAQTGCRDKLAAVAVGAAGLGTPPTRMADRADMAVTAERVHPEVTAVPGEAPRSQTKPGAVTGEMVEAEVLVLRAVMEETVGSSVPPP